MFKYNNFFNKYNMYFIINYTITVFLPLTLKFITFLIKLEFKNFFYYNTLEKNFILFLMKKEFLYTKLKYSRVPQVDIASGASAGLLAGLLGFIVTEKFGFELLDSGDFYTLLMYLGILILILRLFIKSYNDVKSDTNVWNILFNVFNYYISIINIIYNYFYFIFMEVRMWLSNRN